MVLDVAKYKSQQRELEVLTLVSEGAADITAGRTRPAREVLRDLAKRKPRGSKTSR